MDRFHWTALIGYFLWCDVRKPTVSGLAVREASQLRVELEHLRKTLAELERSASSCDWTSWYLTVSLRILSVTWALIFLTLVWILAKKQKPVLVRSRAPQLQMSDRVEDEPETPSSRTSGSSFLATRGGPVRPSDLRRRDGRSDAEYLGSASSSEVPR